MKPNQSTTPTSTSEAGASDVGDRLYRFVWHLAESYRRLCADESVPGGLASDLTAHVQGLDLAAAALRHAASLHASTRPPQVVVLGPTQTGKSTIVNLLLGRNATPVSPLAGFTVHPRGFWVGGAGGGTPWAEGLLEGLERCEPEKLNREELSAWSLSAVDPPAGASFEGLFGPESPADAALPPCVVWDTPDFDSLGARAYDRGVFELAALADAFVLVLSKEKYSDLSVWQVLELLAPLGRPLVICLNKMTPESEAVVGEALRQRLAERGSAWESVSVVTMPHDENLAAQHWQSQGSSVQELRAAVCAGLEKGCERRPGRAGVAALLHAHWDDWLRPVRAENAALEGWQRLIAAQAEEFLAAYRRDYLEHPQRYDSFRRAAVELLDLLELPRIGGIIARTRQVVTWPARRLFAAGQRWWDERHGRAGRRHSLGVEARVLVDALDALLARLQREATRCSARQAPGRAVWQALATRLEQQQGQLEATFKQLVEDHHRQMSEEIRAAANKLYDELRKHPTRLNALRTARVTIDAGYVLLAVKTAGLSLLDAVWAPAAFGLTSLLTEGAAGLEMGRVARQLKEKQWKVVQEEFVQHRLMGVLGEVAVELHGPGLLEISEDDVSRATQALDDWEHDHE